MGLDKMLIFAVLNTILITFLPDYKYKCCHLDLFFLIMFSFVVIEFEGNSTKYWFINSYKVKSLYVSKIYINMSKNVPILFYLNDNNFSAVLVM